MIEEVTKTGLFGDSFFELKWRTIPNGGLRVKKPFGGDYFIYDEADGLVHDSSEFPGGVIPFRKTNDRIAIIFVNTCPVQCKGYVPVSAFDDEVPVDWSVTYDVGLVYSAGRAEQIVNFIFSNRLLNGMAGQVFEKLSRCVESVVKEVMGRHSREGVEKINADNIKISEEILSRLNSVGGGMYDYGLTAKSFTFNVADDYMHRAEKKRIRQNRSL